MANASRRSIGPFNPSTLETRSTLSTDQHSNTLNTLPGKACVSRHADDREDSRLGSGNSTISTTTPKAGKTATAVFPAGQTWNSAAVMVTDAHLQLVDLKASKGGCCPNVAQ